MPDSLSVADALTVILVVSYAVTVKLLIVGAVPSVILALAWSPAFIPSVNLAYTVSPWFKFATFPPFAIVVHVPDIEFT